LRAGGDAAEAAWSREEVLEQYNLVRAALRIIYKAFQTHHGGTEARRKDF